MVKYSVNSIETIGKEEDMSIREDAVNAIKELCDVAKLKAGDILVIGCSTSEVVGEKIGTSGSETLPRRFTTQLPTCLFQREYILHSNAVSILTVQ